MGFSGAAAIGLVGSYMQSNAAQGAANTQAQSGQNAISTQQQMLREQQALQEPFRGAGLQALQQLVQGSAPGGQFAQPFKMEESQAQQFATKESLAAMQSQMATGGQSLSTNAITGAGQLAGNIASQYEGQAYNQWLASQQQQVGQLQYLSGLGQAAASGQASNLGQAGTNISNLQTGIGNAQAAGQVGSANAYSGAANNVSQYMMLQSLMNQHT